MSGEIFGGGIMETWMFDTMVSMTLLMALVLLIRKPVSHFFGAHISYLLWILPLARLFMPTLTLTAPPPTETAASLAPTLVASELAASAPGQQMVVSAFASLDWVMIAAILWAGGAGLLFLSKLAGYFQFREDIISDGQLVGRHENIKILETAAVSGPLAFGLFDKYIAVPTDFFRNYAPRERELALEHEIAHHEAGDLVANFVGLMILSLHWFNPVAWFAWIAFRQDQETACDARILQKGGQGVRAVYGRTIAKSASGVKLGLASPLNQKDKIKDRLKMLGQTEKSSVRKRIGAGLVAVGTVFALPLTATVVYAEADIEDADAAHDTDVDADDAHTVSKKVKITVDKDGKKKKIVKVRKSGYASGDRSSADIKKDDAAGETVNILMLNGEKDWDKVRANGDERVYRIKRDGRTIVLRTNEDLSKEEVKEMVREAEESRLEAERELKEHEAEHRQEMREAEREMRETERELEQVKRESRLERTQLDREARHAIRDAMREAREAMQEAREARTEALKEAERETRKARRQTSNVWSIAHQVSGVSFAPRAPRAPHPPEPAVSVDPVVSHSIADCKAMNKQIAFAGRRGGQTDQVWASVAGCANIEVKVDRKALLKVTLRGLERSRAEAAKCNSKDKQQKVRAFDRDIKKLKSQLSMT